jgi:hypothetical protein
MRNAEYRVERRVQAPPEAVLAAIQDAARRGEIHARLPRGTRGVGGRVRGEHFTVVLGPRDEDPVTELVGMVVRAAGGGSVVRASVQYDRNAAPTDLAVMGLAVVAAGTGVAGGWWLAAFASLFAMPSIIRDAAGVMGHDQARFVVAWLDHVLARFHAAPEPEPRTRDPAPRAARGASAAE